MRAIPIPLRKRILELYERGKSTREIAQFSGFCVAAVRRVRQQFRQRRTLEPRTHRCGRKTLLTEERKQRLRELLCGAARCHPGRVGRPPGPLFPHFHDRSLVAAAGLEV